MFRRKALRDYTCNDCDGASMSLKSVLRFFLPQDDKFLPLIEQSADNVRDASNVYLSLAKTASRAEIAAVRDQIKELEHIAVTLTHRIFEGPSRAVVSRFDREYIFSLTDRMDDVLDLMDDVADRFLNYQIAHL